MNGEELEAPSSATIQSTDATRPFSAADLPAYVSHKVVRAAKINAWTTSPAAGEDQHASLTLYLEGDYPPLSNLDPKLFARYVPNPGDYFVVYADGYQSISPAKAFEEGYKRVESLES